MRKKVDLTSLNRIMVRYYGSRKMTVLTNVENKNFINQCDISLEFDYDSSIKIDFMILLKKIRRYIIFADFFLNIIEQENKVKIYVMLYEKPEYNNYDFEFSEN